MKGGDDMAAKKYTKPEFIKLSMSDEIALAACLCQCGSWFGSGKGC
jgi:hypothetical protein